MDGHEPPLGPQVLDRTPDDGTRPRRYPAPMADRRRRITGGTARSLYQIYPRSYQDTNGDGVGDLRGIIERLDHLQWLGIRGVWLSPVTVSPNADFGYDVADYYDVDPTLGTLADLDALDRRRPTRAASGSSWTSCPNHTSIEHPWFEESRSSRDNPKRDWYVWADPAPDGAPPNNWVSSFGGPAWTLDDADRPVLPAELPAPSSPTSTGGTTRSATSSTASCASGSTAASPGSASTSRTWSIKDRELRDNPPRGRRTTRSSSRCAASGQVYNAQPARGARRPPPAGGRSPTPTTRRAARRRDVRRADRGRDPVLRHRRRAATSPSTSRSCTLPFDAAALRDVIERDRGS